VSAALPPAYGTYFFFAAKKEVSKKKRGSVICGKRSRARKTK
jgi:hypothetical protein